MTDRPRRPTLHLKNPPPAAPTLAPAVRWKCKPCGAPFEVSRSLEGGEAFRRTMALMAAGNQLAVVLDAIALSVEAEAADTLCSILLLDDSGQRLTLGAGSSLPDDYNAAIEGLAIGPNTGSCGTAAFLNQRVIVEDIQTDPLWVDFKDLAAAAGLRACWSQPIRGARGEVLGTFGIYHRQVPP